MNFNFQSVFWRVLLLSFIIFYHNETKAQNTWKVNAYEHIDGIQENEIQSCVTLKSGFTFVLTQNGLYRFDGNHFLRYSSNPKDTKTIPSGKINSLEIDEKGHLWLLQVNNISCYNEHDDSFLHYPIPENFPVQQFNYGFYAVNDKIWLGAKGDFVVFDTKTNKYELSGWRNFSNTQVSKFDAPVNGIGILRKSTSEIWLLGTSGLYSYHLKTKQYKYYYSPKFTNMQGKSLNLYVNNKLYLGSYNDGIIEYDAQLNKWDNYLLPEKLLDEHKINSIYNIVLYGKANELIATTRNKLVTFNLETKKFEALHLTDIQFNAIDVNPNFLYIDKLNNRFWIGTKQGLYRKYDNTIFDFKELNKDKVNHFFNLYFEDIKNNQIFYGSIYSNELWIKDIKNGTIKKVKSLNEIDLNFVTTIKNDATGNTWLCMRNDVLMRRAGKKIWEKIKLPQSPKGNNNRVFWNIAFDGKGSAYICSWTDGILEMNSEFQFEKFLPLKNKVADNRYTDIAVNAEKQEIYISTEQEGLCIWDITNQNSTWLAEKNKHLKSLLTSTINDIEKDTKNQVWVSTQTQGLWRYNSNNNKIESFGFENSLNSASVNWSFIDTKNRLWVAVPGSLYLYHNTVNSFQQFGASSGYPKSEVYQAFCNSKGRLVFGTMNGFVEMSETNLAQTLEIPKPYFQSIFAGNQKLNPAESCILDHTNNSISIRFGAIDYNHITQLRFRYRTLPDTNWKYTKEQEISFVALSPNIYEIQIAASNGGSHWSDTIPFKLKINKPFYQSYWFFFALIIIVFFVVRLGVKRQILSIRKEAKLKQKIAETEMNALRARMNPHFIFNCLNSIDNLIHAQQADAATKYLNQFAKLIRDVLENAQKQEITFQKDWENIQRYLDLEQLRFDNQIQLEISVSPELFSGNYKVPPLIIQPFLENAIHHGLRNSSKKIKILEISAKIENETLIYTITDNGIGRAAAAVLPKNQWNEKSSQGVKISLERIQLHNKDSSNKYLLIEDLKTEKGIPSGTRVTIKIMV